MKKMIGIIGAALLLSSCGDPGRVQAGDEILSSTTTGVIQTPDGRKVTCVVWQGYQAGSISCDWEHSR